MGQGGGQGGDGSTFWLLKNQTIGLIWLVGQGGGSVGATRQLADLAGDEGGLGRRRGRAVGSKNGVHCEEGGELKNLNLAGDEGGGRRGGLGQGGGQGGGDWGGH